MKSITFITAMNDKRGVADSIIPGEEFTCGDRNVSFRLSVLTYLKNARGLSVSFGGSSTYSTMLKKV